MVYWRILHMQSNVKLQVKVTRVQGYNVTHKSYNDVKC